VNSIRQTGVHDDFSEHSFRRWRPADIAHADEKYTYGCMLIHKPLFNLIFLCGHARRNPGVSEEACSQNCTHKHLHKFEDNGPAIHRLVRNADDIDRFGPAIRTTRAIFWTYDKRSKSESLSA
jgi:hypothetical protein